MSYPTAVPSERLAALERRAQNEPELACLINELRQASHDEAAKRGDTLTEEEADYVLRCLLWRAEQSVH